MLPFKFVGFWLIAHHHSGLGLAIFIVAKVVGTAFLARIFELTKPALLGIEWFQKLYLRLSTWRDQLYAYVRSFRAWRMANAWITNARVALRALVRTGLGNRVLYELWDEQSLATKVATINIVAVTAFVIVKAIFG
jgi:hypothetical protein